MKLGFWLLLCAARTAAASTSADGAPRGGGSGAAGGQRQEAQAPPSAGLGDLHDDMLQHVLARLPPASYFRVRAVCRWWRAAAPRHLWAAASASPLRVPRRAGRKRATSGNVVLPVLSEERADDAEAVPVRAAHGAALGERAAGAELGGLAVTGTILIWVRNSAPGATSHEVQ